MESIDFLYVPEDMVMDILLRLPAISCVRFRCVSKAWYSLLSDPIFMYKNLTSHDDDDDDDDDEFIIKRLDYLEDKNYFCIICGDNLDYKVSSAFDKEIVYGPFIKLVGCCNGLVCIIDDWVRKFFVWNPATKEIKILPQSTNYKTRIYKHHDYDAGFCFDPEVNDYIVIRFYRKQWCRDMIKAEFYSFRGDCWKKIEFFRPYNREYRHIRVINSHGKLFHGLAEIDLDSQDSHHRMEQYAVLSFDLNLELFKTTITPFSKYLGAYALFFKLKKSVAMCIAHNDSRETIFEIWVLLKIGVKESWMKLIRIGPFNVWIDKILSWKKGKLVLCATKGDVILFDPFTREIATLLYNDPYRSGIQIKPYKRTHLQLGEINGS